KVEPHAPWVHIDVADGTFTPNTLWHAASDLQGVETPLSIEAHLMIRDIDTRYAEWLIPQVKRLIIHLEAGHDIGYVVQNIKGAGKEVVLGILPETPWEKTRPFWGTIDGVLLLSVSPGLPGQAMDERTEDKIRGLHNACPDCILEVDGGVNKKTAPLVFRAGASRVASASAIFGESNIKEAIETLQHASS
ncbi:MAG: hypothetical protein COU47_02905, partial [Candidatus Niyogibacteria bacterium CG10_big_fil_rev_8_21_14_0_10_46_36]